MVGTTVYTQYDVDYLPQPNRIDLVLTTDQAPAHLTRTAFMVPVTPHGVILANNRRRGVEIPGGHVEPGETLAGAAWRETLEETGCYADLAYPIGYLRMVSEALVPLDWPYPHPISYQQFFAGRIHAREAYVPNDECLEPVTVLRDAVAQLEKPTTRYFVEAALRRIAARP
ncbi:8-oxo-dGTP diphosphatase [Brevundimonas phage vB_BpoS-Kikimora]|uniref:8-oxo-dGTP diphosphatase n=1 Tax=Brevundimonas phage vB_BpoS-Kikimora TaxID=2948601 RepID=A0A9E7MRF2_9CAUD|nr:8-oxo-dGTP diphosphatase [Brevundimonas phage vB_BpoS-Kikimora]